MRGITLNNLVQRVERGYSLDLRKKYDSRKVF